MVGLPQNQAMNITKNLGMLLLAIYLILVGITALPSLCLPGNRDGTPGTGGWYFDPYRQIATAAQLTLRSSLSL
jgi:hypothetical protein